jgi:hypothetical protein
MIPIILKDTFELLVMPWRYKPEVTLVEFQGTVRKACLPFQFREVKAGM